MKDKKQYHKHEKFWMVKPRNMRPLETMFETEGKATKAAETKCKENKRPYYILEATRVVRTKEVPIVVEELVEREENG